MRQGSERRLAIIDHILQMNGLHVNRKWCLLTKDDSDLKKMLKDGTLIQTREGRMTSKYTVLKLGGKNA